MDTRFQEPVRQETQAIRDIDRDTSRIRLDPLPLLTRRADLQRRDGLSEQEREGTEIRVALDPDVVEQGVLAGGAFVVFHVAQVAV